MNGDFHVVRGPTRIAFRRGTCDVVGQTISSGRVIEIARGKSIIIQEQSSDCEFETSFEQGGTIALLDQSPYPEDWEILVDNIERDRLQKVIVLGEMDTGKTFLCTYLANRLLGRGYRVAIIDCDLGQSDIGPPGCLGLSLLDQPLVFMADAPVHGLHFVGAHSPEGHLTSMIVGLQRLTQQAARQADFIFIDTCGWTLGDGARILKSSKIMVVEPELVLLLQRTQELEHLVSPFPEQRVFRLKVSKSSSPTDQMVRQKLREKISRAYFQNAALIQLTFDTISTMGSYFRTGREISRLGDHDLLYGESYAGYEGHLIVPRQDFTHEEELALMRDFPLCRIFRPGWEKDVLVGLLDNRLATVGLGVVKEFDFKTRTISLYTPVTDVSAVRTIAFGSLRYHPDGREAGFIKQGLL